MSAYEINFLQPSKLAIPRATWLGILMFVLTIGLLVYALSHYWQKIQIAKQSDEQQQYLQQKLDGLQKSKRKPVDKIALYSAEELKQIREINQLGQTPWAAIFSALELASADNVALLSMSPNLSKHLIELTGEAKNFDAATHYLTLLQMQSVFKKVYLQTHEYDEENKNAPMYFVVEIEWGDA